jgi:hypothetical protein
VFIVLAHRRRRVFDLKEQDNLDKQFAEVEKKGIEIPDELKKVRTRIIKDEEVRKSMGDQTDNDLR